MFAEPWFFFFCCFMAFLCGLDHLNSGLLLPFFFNTCLLCLSPCVSVFWPLTEKVWFWVICVLGLADLDLNFTKKLWLPLFARRHLVFFFMHMRQSVCSILAFVCLRFQGDVFRVRHLTPMQLFDQKRSWCMLFIFFFLQTSLMKKHLLLAVRLICVFFKHFFLNFLVCHIWSCFLFQHPLYHFLDHIRSCWFLTFYHRWATNDIFCTLTMIPYQTQHLYKPTPVEVQMGPFNIVYFRMRSHIKSLKIKNELLPKYLWCGLYGDAFWCLVKSCIRGFYNLLAWSGCIYNSWIQTITPSRFILQFALCFRLSTRVL